jgi:uncharacterized protein YjgD (DUF1641 family)
MATVSMEDRIAELDRKLDFIATEMVHLKQVRSSAEDLVADLTIVSKDAMKELTVALSATPVRPAEITELLKTVLANTGLLTQALQQLDSASDFLKDSQIVARDAMRQLTQTFQGLQEKGYFEIAQVGLRLSDIIVQAHSTEDLKQIESSVPQFIGFMRELTRPEVLEALEAIIHGFGRVQATMDVDKSFFAIARDMTSPEARRGISILVEFLKIVGARSQKVTPA